MSGLSEKNLLTLENVTLPRSYKPEDFGKNIIFLMQVRVDMGKSPI